MVFGTGPFICDECGEKFNGTYAEWYATSFITPQRCPKCGSQHTYPPASLFSFLFEKFVKESYRDIWEYMDKNNEQ